MNHFLNIVRKEVRELLTPTTLIPIVIMALIFGGMGNMIGGAMEEAKEKPIIGLVNADSGAFSILATNVSAELAEVR
ncbi:MAG: ABC transporter permease, partial [Thermoplasmata archaeon]